MAETHSCKVDENDRELLLLARNGDRRALDAILTKHRGKLKKMISLRMNPRLQSRLDASDVVQETFVEAVRTLDKYLNDSKLPVYVWLRALANEKLIQAHRFHLGAKKRDASRELSIYGNSLSATSEAMVVQLIGGGPTPEAIAEKNDRKLLLAEALEKMDPLDREVLTLRHFENLTSRQAALILEIKHETVKKRYVRALEKLQRILVTV